jgi:tricorn protease
MTLMLAQPAVSADHVAFTYAGDLWIARHDGSGVRQVTTHKGVESSPRFSPDGRTLAFSAQYDGNTDVYVVPVEGGVPRRLTWHPGSDIVQDFTVDGSAVLFTSARAVYTGRHRQLFTVTLDGKFPEQLPVPTAFKATYSPDGSKSVEELPRRNGDTDLDHRHGGLFRRSDPAARGPLQRHRSHVDRRPCLLPL